MAAGLNEAGAVSGILNGVGEHKCFAFRLIQVRGAKQPGQRHAE